MLTYFQLVNNNQRQSIKTVCSIDQRTMSTQEWVTCLNNETKCCLTLNGKHDTLRHEDGSVVVENFTGSIVIEGEKQKKTMMATSTPNTASVVDPVSYTPVDRKKFCTPIKEATQDNSDEKHSNKEQVNDSISLDEFSDGYVDQDRGLSQQVNHLDEELLM